MGSASMPHAVDNADWLKAAAIVLVSVGHFGQFFMEDDRWWSVFGCLAVPMFFFLMGYAQSRTVPLRWIWLGVGLTLLDSSNTGWTWQAPNILLSFVLLRVARPHVKALLQRYGWGVFVLLVSGLVAALPVAAEIVDYGTEGWLWALFGLCQRMHADCGSAAHRGGQAQSLAPPAQAIAGKLDVMRLLACLFAAVVFVWQEHTEYSFIQIQLALVILGVGVLSTVLCLFHRGPSPIQPPGPWAAALRFIGRHTLEIYAIQLAGSELIIMLMPDLAA